MKQFFVTVAALFLLTGISQAQHVISIKSTDDFFRMQRTQAGVNKVMTEKDIKGSPYLKPEFEKGHLLTVSHEKYEGIMFRYNVFNDEMEFEGKDGVAMAIPVPSIVAELAIGDSKFVYAPYTYSKRILRGYSQLLSNGKASLLKKYNIILQPAQDAGAYKEPQPVEFVDKIPEYFIRIGENEAVKISNAKDLVAVLNEQKSKIENFIKTNKLNAKKEDDLKKIVEYYNSL